MKLPVAYRAPTEEDLPFIYSTWLKSYRNTDWAKHMSNDTYYFHHKAICAAILESPTTVTTLICDESDPEQLYGYVVAQVIGGKPLLHFAYIKYNFRKLGLMKSLIQHLGYFNTSGQVNFITHLPRNYTALRTKYNLEYNPYLLGTID